MSKDSSCMTSGTFPTSVRKGILMSFHSALSLEYSENIEGIHL